MCQADGCHSFWQVVPCPVESSQFAVVGILLGDIDSFIVSYAAKMKIDSFLCSNLDRGEGDTADDKQQESLALLVRGVEGKESIDFQLSTPGQTKNFKSRGLLIQ